MQSGAAAAHGVGHGRDGLVLANHPLVEFFLQVEELVALALHHPRHGDSRPAAHHLGDIVGSHLLADEFLATLRLVELLLYGLDVGVYLLQFAIAYLRHELVVALALGALGVKLQLLYLLFVLLDLVDQGLLGLPFGSESLHLVLQFGYLALDVVEFLQVGVLLGRSRLHLALHRLTLDLLLLQLSLQFVQFLRHGVALHTEFGSSLIHEVDGLVGEETVCDVAFGELHGGDAGVVLDTHLVVVLVALLQST